MRQCKNSSSCNVPTHLLLLLGLLVASALAAAGDPVPTVDTRKTYDREAPSWLRAVGKLEIPGSVYRNGARSHLRENCSASLVADGAVGQARTIVTAWHCLANYSDLSRPIVFTLLPDSENVVRREAYRLADGGGMHADWAILRLRSAIDRNVVAPLALQPGRVDAARTISMAGYSRDEGKGRGGRQLTYDPGCRITAESDTTADSDCIAHKGASGGAVVQLSPAGVPQFSGVISAGDGNGVSTFVPVSVFRAALYRPPR